MMKKIGQAMKGSASDAQLKLRDDLREELRTKDELIRDLRQQLEVRAAYVLGMLEANPNAAPSAEFLDSLIG